MIYQMTLLNLLDSKCYSESEKFAPLGNLTNKAFDLIKSENGWLDDSYSSGSGIFETAKPKC